MNKEEKKSMFDLLWYASLYRRTFGYIIILVFYKAAWELTISKSQITLIMYKQ